MISGCSGGCRHKVAIVQVARQHGLSRREARVVFARREMIFVRTSSSTQFVLDGARQTRASGSLFGVRATCVPARNRADQGSQGQTPPSGAPQRAIPSAVLRSARRDETVVQRIPVGRPRCASTRARAPLIIPSSDGSPAKEDRPEADRVGGCCEEVKGGVYRAGSHFRLDVF